MRETAEALCRHGVRASFGVTGSGPSWQLITALELGGVRYHAAAHEAAAAIMAGAFARQSNTLGCAISIKGPGLANMVAGLLSNRYEQWPVLSVSEAYDTSRPSPRMHKRLDQRMLLAPIVKQYAAGFDPATVAALAVSARAEVPGPVHLDLAPGAATSVSGPGDISPVRNDESWDPIRRRVDAAKRPMVIAGALATRRAWGSCLRQLQIPVFTTVAAKGCLDERHPMAAGVFTGDGKALAPESVLAPEADLVVGLGLRNLEVLTPKPFATPLVGLEAADDSALLDGFEPAASLMSATDEQFGAMLTALGTKRWGADLVQGAVARVRERLTDDDWLPGSVFAALQQLAGEGACLVTDTGVFCTVAEHVWQAADAASFVASANGRYMGTGLPMAIGAALARPTTPTLCVVGDGGVRPFWAEIKLAIAERLPICVVLMTDGRYGSIAAAASATGLTRSAVDIPNPSWFRAAEALGCPAHHVTSHERLAQALTLWRRDGGSCFVEAPFPQEPYATMTADLR